MKKLTAAFLAIFLMVVFLAAGSWTANTYFWKPVQGDTGVTTNMNTGFDRADAMLGLLGQVQSFYKLRVANNSSVPATKIDITAVSVTTFDVSNAPKIIQSFSSTVNCLTNGANGLDTGALATGWYYFYVIAKSDGTSAGLASTSSTSPTMPSGYTFKKLVSAIYYNTGFYKIHQTDRMVDYDGDPATGIARLLFTTGSASWTLIDLSSVVPANALRIQFIPASISNTFDVGFSIAWSGTPTTWQTFSGKLGSNNPDGLYYAGSPFLYRLNPTAPQTLYVIGDDGNNRGSGYCAGYELDI